MESWILFLWVSRETCSGENKIRLGRCQGGRAMEELVVTAGLTPDVHWEKKFKLKKEKFRSHTKREGGCQGMEGEGGD